jgi:3-dehydroquinate synthase
LPRRELVAGWCETLKQGIVASRKLFNQTIECLRAIDAGGAVITPRLEELIAAHCAFKAGIVAGDEREESGRRDRRSRRILNFGHTIAHAIEAVTGYRRFRHGEAVGYGMLVAGELSKHLGLLPSAELELLREGVRLCGPLPLANDLDLREIAGAISRDKKSERGQVQWVLLERIGQPTIVDGKQVSRRLLLQSLQKVMEQG